jgi:hypothetical protein
LADNPDCHEGHLPHESWSSGLPPSSVHPKLPSVKQVWVRVPMSSFEDRARRKRPRSCRDRIFPESRPRCCCRPSCSRRASLCIRK